MAEKPIIFSDEMVRAILDGRKTQTQTQTPVEEPNDLAKVFGAWPGDESDEEIEALLSERTPEEETLHAALRLYGFKEQLAMLQEECGELVAAVNRYRRGRPDAFEAMIDEMADVSILIDQMRLVYGAEIDAARARKVARLGERLGDDERMQAIVEDALTVADQAGEAWDRMVEDGLARVCPGCHAVGEERCAPGCIDAELEEERQRAIESWDYGCEEDDDG